MFERSRISDLPYELVTLDSLRRIFFAVGAKSMHVTLCKADGGFVVRAHLGYQPKGGFSVKAEKSGQQRVFKSLEPALRVCRQLGLDRVQVEL
jgi:hypothetical protein